MLKFKNYTRKRKKTFWLLQGKLRSQEKMTFLDKTPYPGLPPFIWLYPLAIRNHITRTTSILTGKLLRGLHRPELGKDHLRRFPRKIRRWLASDLLVWWSRESWNWSKFSLGNGASGFYANENKKLRKTFLYKKDFVKCWWNLHEEAILKKEI